jgi:hypothetical protein
MQKLLPSRIAIVIALLQSAMALLAWLVSWSAFLFLGSDIDADNPGHQVTIADRLAETILVFGLPVLWATAAAVLIWFRIAAAWWLCVLGDITAVCLGIGLLRNDLSQISDIRTHPALYPDVAYHLCVLLLPAAALCLLFSHSIRLSVPGLAIRIDGEQHLPS